MNKMNKNVFSICEYKLFGAGAFNIEILFIFYLIPYACYETLHIKSLMHGMASGSGGQRIRQVYISNCFDLSALG